MSGSNRQASGGGPTEPTYFEQQREALVNDIAMNLERVLQNVNKLNRSLEGIMAVGTEFSQVEGLWSQFENVMARPEEATRDDNADANTSTPRRGEDGQG